jgi:RNA polymerase sigma-70 factor (ECF subfamily)
MEDITTDTDESLLQRVSKGDESAFSALYERFSGKLYGLVKRILEDEQDASDVLQEGFVYLWEKASQYDASKSRAFTWSVIIFRNKAIDKVRSRRRRIKLNETAADELAPLAEEVERADHAAERGERAVNVRNALASLTEEQRKCIECAFFRGFTQHQVAEIFGEPLGTVKTNIRRGLLRMRELLKGGAE